MFIVIPWLKTVQKSFQKQQTNLMFCMHAGFKANSKNVFLHKGISKVILSYVDPQTEEDIFTGKYTNDQWKNKMAGNYR